MNTRENAGEALKELLNYFDGAHDPHDLDDSLIYIAEALDEHDGLLKACKRMFRSLAAFVHYAPAGLKEECYAPKESLELGRAAITRAESNRPRQRLRRLSFERSKNAESGGG